MVSQKVIDLCQGTTTVSSELGKDPSLAPGKVIKQLYGDDVGGHDEHKTFVDPEPTPEDLKKAWMCGKWGDSHPSDFFLKVYHDALCTLEGDPMVGMTSPPLMGSYGVVPLSIIAPLPDICRHMSNCIARAQKEVFLATNYWQSSDASTLITNALKELSRRAGERGEKAIVKIIYDRGKAKQVIDNHQIVGVDEYTGKNVRLPHPDELPHVDLQVVNYHRPVFGTFHSKYMVIDRKIAILSSNNIQDNDNLEMMTHIEGPIVDSFYDMSLCSWSKELTPPLPCLSTPAAQGGLPTYEQRSQGQKPAPMNVPGANSGTRAVPGMDASGELHPHLASGERIGSPEATNPQNKQTGKDDLSSRTGALNLNQQQGVAAAGTSTEAHPHIPSGETLGQSNVATTGSGDLGNVANVVHESGKAHLPEHTEKDPNYDPDIPAEIARAQSVLLPRGSERRVDAITRHLNTTIQPDTKGNAPDVEEGNEMTPLIPHPVHDPIPMALVCRKPWGSPNHAMVHNPQNEAFLSAVRNAQRTVFIQTPNLNAEPLLPALLAAVRRGIQVTYYVCLGYNDAGELLPFQGGTNEMIALRLYSQLSDAEKKNLHIFNYVAKDQTRPIHNKFKKRSCHIKILIADSHIGIQGNGNQDTQSWYHSQEANVLIDSAEVCKAWEEGIRRNQNTHLYGAVDKESGCWVDEKGEQAEGALGTDVGRFSWAKGVVGAVNRVRGAGGF